MINQQIKAIEVPLQRTKVQKYKQDTDKSVPKTELFSQNDWGNSIGRFSKYSETRKVKYTQ